MTTLLAHVEGYLKLRRALGFKLRHQGFMLPDFARFIARRGGRITSQLALAWATRDVGASPHWWATRLSMARSFAKFVYPRDPRTEIPPKDLLVVAARTRLIPYVFTDADIAALMRCARRAGGVRGATDAALLGLLFATGMRVGEAIGLDRDDVDLRRCLISVRGAKGGKTRQVPLHRTTARALAGYGRQRDRALPSPSSPAFFLSSVGQRVHHQNFHHRYRRFLDETGLAKQPTHRPRLHDLRHTFIITTLVDWYRRGVDVETRLAALSTYVGHVSPSSTYWYLTATKDLLKQAARRLEREKGRRP